MVVLHGEDGRIRYDRKAKQTAQERADGVANSERPVSTEGGFALIQATR